eukprot:SAG22_NODE_4381_length_1286_cov_9.211457_1_plen_216_part_00
MPGRGGTWCRRPGNKKVKPNYYFKQRENRQYCLPPSRPDQRPAFCQDTRQQTANIPNTEFIFLTHFHNIVLRHRISEVSAESGARSVIWLPRRSNSVNEVNADRHSVPLSVQRQLVIASGSFPLRGQKSVVQVPSPFAPTPIPLLFSARPKVLALPATSMSLHPSSFRNECLSPGIFGGRCLQSLSTPSSFLPLPNRMSLTGSRDGAWRSRVSGP